MRSCYSARMSNNGTKSRRTQAWVLDLVALDLWLGNKLSYTVTRLTEHDARKRSVMQRTMEDLCLGQYNIAQDMWVLSRKAVIAYLKRVYAKRSATGSARRDLARALLDRAKRQAAS